MLKIKIHFENYIILININLKFKYSQKIIYVKNN